MPEPFNFEAPDLSVAPQAPAPAPSTFSFTPPDLSTPTPTQGFNFQVPDLNAPTAPSFPSTFKKDKTVGGFAKNFIDDASETLKGLGHLLFVDLPQLTVINPARAAVGGALDVDKQWRDKYLKDWSDRINKWTKDPAGSALEGGGLVVNALIDPYWDSKNHEFKWDFWYERPFTVLADAATLASLGAGSAGKAANVAGKATRVGEGLTKVATTLGNAEKVLNPINWVTTGASKLAAPVLASFGIGEHSPALTKIVGETRAEQLAEREAMRPIREITPVEGGIKTPDLLEVKETPVTGVLTPDEAADILKQAKNQVDQRLKIKGNIDDIETGKRPKTEEMQDRVSDAFYDIKWRRETLNRINNYLIENKVVSPTRISGYEPINLEGLRRYYDTTLNMIEEYKKGFDGATALGADAAHAHNAGAGAVKAFTQKIKDLDMGKDLLWAPKHVANYLKHEFVPRAPGLMDSFYKYWTPTVTSFRFPMYQASVLAGNTVMAILYGASPKDWGMVNKLRKTNAFATELQPLEHARLMDEWARGEGAFGPFRAKYLEAAKWAGQFTAGSDAKLRQLIATHFLSKQLEAGVLGSIPTGAALEAALTEVLKSKQAMREILAEIKATKGNELEAGIVRDRTIENLVPMPDSLAIRQGGESINIRQPLGKEAQGRGKSRPRVPLMEEITPVEGGIKTPDLLEVTTTRDVGGKRMPEGAKTPKEGIRGAEGLESQRQATHFTTEAQLAKDADYLKRQTAIRESLEAKVPDLQRKIDLLNKAMEEGNRWAGNALALHPFERNVLSRLVPFYSYTKAMTALAFSAPILYPKRMFLLNRLAKLTADMMHDPAAPEWVQEYVPFGFDDDGNVLAFRMGSFNPFSGVRGEEFGDLPIPGLIDPTRNPVVKLIYEMAGGTPHWSKKPLSPGEYSVRYGDGTIYEYQKDGTFKKVLAQPSIVKTALGTVPLLQAIHELGDSYVVDDRGRPLLGPDGKPRFPKDLWTRLLPIMGARGAEYKPEELARQMNRKGGSIMKEFRNALRMERDPERRQQILDILKDAAAAEHRKVENQ